MTSRRVAPIVLIGAVALAVSAAFWFGLGHSDADEAGPPFTRPAWADAGPHGASFGARKRLVRELLENHLRIGMSQVDVGALLGDPDFESRRVEGEYWVWKCSPHPIGSGFYSLVIRWDTDGALLYASAPGGPQIGR